MTARKGPTSSLSMCHLVVIQHGLWGHPDNTKYLANLLEEQLGEGFVFLNCAENIGNLTYDGIDVCGDRLHEAIKAKMAELAMDGEPHEWGRWK